MKRWLVWSLVSVATFAVGTVLVFIYLTATAPTYMADRIADPPSEKSLRTSNASPIEPNFVPEFHNLPDFGEVEYETPKGRLIEMMGDSDGVFRRGDLEAKNGEKWHVLVKRKTGYSLEIAKANVRNLKTISWPGDEKDAKISFNLIGEPIIAFNGFAGFKPGPVETLFQQSWGGEKTKEGELINEEVSDGYTREFLLNGQRYVLRTSRGLTKDGTKVAVFVLESNRKVQVLKQVIHVPTDDQDIIGSLLWVGDLDRDGRLDLYFDEFNEKGFTATELHLSSHAEDDKLVGLAADFGVAGC